MKKTRTETRISREKALEILDAAGLRGWDPLGDYYVEWDGCRETLRAWGHEAPLVENTSTTSWT